MQRLLSHQMALAILVLGDTVSPALAQSYAQPQARVGRIHTVHNVYRDGQKGMPIQLNMELDGLKDRQIGVAAFFALTTPARKKLT